MRADAKSEGTSPIPKAATRKAGAEAAVAVHADSAYGDGEGATEARRRAPAPVRL